MEQLLRYRYLDTARPRLRYPQIIHLHPCSTYRIHHPQGRQNSERLGMEYWQGPEPKGHQRLQFWSWF